MDVHISLYLRRVLTSTIINFAHHSCSETTSAMPQPTDHYRGTLAKVKQSDNALQRSLGKQDLIAEEAAVINELFPPLNSQMEGGTRTLQILY